MPPVSFRSPGSPNAPPPPTYTPSPEQLAVERWVAEGSGHAFVEAVAGCLAADTVIEVNRGGKSYKTTIAQLVFKMSGGAWAFKGDKPFDLSIPTRVRSCRDGVVRLADVESGVFSGRKRVYAVTAGGGRLARTVKATADHLFLTGDGWRRLSDLRKGDDLLIDLGKSREAPVARKRVYRRLAGMAAHPYHHKSAPHCCVWTHRLVAEAQINGLPFDEFVRRIRAGETSGLVFLDPAEFHVHHKDNDHLNNSPDNLDVLTVEAHLRLHANEGGWRHAQATTGTARIELVRCAGYEDTFDLTMRDQDHPNFLANGVVVHNSGKTTTIVGACRLMRGSVAFAAFNKKIAEELSARTPNPRVSVGTFHSFGFRAYCRGRKVQVDGAGKEKRMLVECGVPYPLRRGVGKLVSIAKQSVVGKLWDPDDEAVWRAAIDHHDVMLLCEEGTRVEDLIEYAERCVVWAMLEERVVDFDDMLWLPLLLDVPMERRDWVVVDEAQDTNAARRMLARKMLAPHGRALFVGDRHQSIYGFTGADSDAVDLIFRDFAPCASLPLSVTFRCAKAPTRLAQQWVPQITPHADNAEGAVAHLTAEVFEKLWREPVQGVRDGAVEELARLGPGDAILCRNTRPLVSLAFRLIRAGIPAHVEGREIGRSLAALASRWKVDTIPALATMLAQYQAREAERLRAEGSDYGLEALEDRLGTLRVLMEGCETIEELKAKIDRLFQDSGGAGGAGRVVLSTVHKAKGREWERVFVLGWGELMPSRWARQAWQRQQEANLQYVAVTRAKRTLVLLPLLDS